MRRHFAKYFFSIYAPVLMITGVVLITGNGHAASASWGLVASGIAAAHFMQRQRLEELTLFQRLFGDFNARYDRLNDDLQGIVVDPRHLTDADRSKLLDYFNLCAEEYFFFSQGLVPRSVWKAWCRGMLEYLDDTRVAQFWQSEQARGSYYGLTHEIIARGANRDIHRVG